MTLNLVVHLLSSYCSAYFSSRVTTATIIDAITGSASTVAGVAISAIVVEFAAVTADAGVL